jgi:hypothetical protein
MEDEYYLGPWGLRKVPKGGKQGFQKGNTMGSAAHKGKMGFQKGHPFYPRTGNVNKTRGLTRRGQVKTQRNLLMLFMRWPEFPNTEIIGASYKEIGEKFFMEGRKVRDCLSNYKKYI